MACGSCFVRAPAKASERTKSLIFGLEERRPLMFRAGGGRAGGRCKSIMFVHNAPAIRFTKVFVSCFIALARKLSRGKRKDPADRSSQQKQEPRRIQPRILQEAKIQTQEDRKP